MRQGVQSLREFYASPLGHAAREMISRKVTEAWADGSGMDVLALGYATPFVAGGGAGDSGTGAARPPAARPAGGAAGAKKRRSVCLPVSLQLYTALRVDVPV